MHPARRPGRSDSRRHLRYPIFREEIDIVLLRQTTWRVLLGAALACGANRSLADGVEIETEREVEYSNPGDAHLKLDWARPNRSRGWPPRWSAFMVAAGHSATATVGVRFANNWRGAAMWP